MVSNPPSVRRRAVRVIAGSALCVTVGVLPLFLLAGLAVFVRKELGFSEAGLGLAVSAFFLASAVASTPGGALTERLGAAASLRIGTVGCALSSAGVALLAHDWVSLTVLLMLGGATNGLVQPSTNLVLFVGVPERYQALAFGLKHAAIPGAALLAGIAVPLLGSTVGWRWAYGAAAALAMGVLFVVPANDAKRKPGLRLLEGETALAPLLLLTAAAACGSYSANSMTTFLVEWSVFAGFTPNRAGLLLSAGGIAAIVSRMLIGWISGVRRHHHLAATAGLLVLGGGGYLCLAAARVAPGLLLLVGALLGFAAGWGWPGLFTFAIVRLNRHAPAVATGISQTGAFVGAVVGPVTFGAIVEGFGYPAAWAVNFAMACMAAVLMLVGRHMLVTRNRLRAA